MKFFVLLISVLSIFISCSSKKDLQIKYFGTFNNFYFHSERDEFSIPVYKVIFDKTDTIKITSIDTTISIKGKPFKMDDSTIIRTIYKDINNESVCCDIDTSIYFIENINSKNYLFITSINGGSTSVSEIQDEEVKQKQRPNINIPTWGVNIGQFFNQNLFTDTSYKYDYSKYQSEYHKFKIDEDLELNTINFKGDNRRMVSQISKDVYESDVTELLDYIKMTYPFFKITKSLDNENRTEYIVVYAGIIIYIHENKKKQYDVGETKYNITYTDGYIVLKEMIKKLDTPFVTYKYFDLYEVK